MTDEEYQEKLAKADKLMFEFAWKEHDCGGSNFDEFVECETDISSDEAFELIHLLKDYYKHEKYYG